MERYDVFVIGGGGTGSEVAFSLRSESDMKIGIAERDKLGGECNHYGCVPTKVMLRSAKIAATARDADRFGIRIPSVEVDFAAVVQRARDIIDSQSGDGPKPFYENGIDVVFDEVRLVGPNELETAAGDKIQADKIVLATGTVASAPPIQGLEGSPFWTNKEALWTPQEVPESLAVLGTGAIGTEFSQIYARFGAKVTQIEIAPHILPLEDEEAADSMVPALEADGIRILAGATTTAVSHSPAEGWTLEIEGREPVRTQELLVATGRRPTFEVHDLAAAGVTLDDRGKPVLTDTLRTTNTNIWAGGDATGELLFTHVGTYEAELIVADILGRPEQRDYRVIPRVTFSDPEVASVGLTERQARDTGHDVAAGISRFDDNERAHIDGKTYGLVKIVGDSKTGEILGGHIVGEEAGAMIHEIVASMAGGLNARTVGRAIHAYPTLSESVRSAFLELDGAS